LGVENVRDLRQQPPDLDLFFRCNTIRPQQPFANADQGGNG
jgi:hypothetical protein